MGGLEQTSEISKEKQVFNTLERVSQQLINPQVSVPIFADLTEETKQLTDAQAFNTFRFFVSHGR